MVVCTRPLLAPADGGRSLSTEVPVTSPSLSVSACDRVSGSSQIFSQFHFHLNRCFKRHRVQMFVKLRHQAHAIFPHYQSRFISVFVILESVIDCDSCHADIDAGHQWIAFGIQPQNGRMLCNSVAEQGPTKPWPSSRLRKKALDGKVGNGKIAK